MTTLSQLEREAAQILERLRKLETVPVPSAAKLLHKSPEWIRMNLPVVVLSPKTHTVRACDIEAFLARRTVKPMNGVTI